MRPQTMSPRTIAAGIGCLVLVALAIPFWPQAMGGSTAYVVPRGASMEPSLSDGDLTFVRRQSAYQVGDVVAYRNTSLHRVVVHRIVAVDNGSYTFKGDANSFRDPQTVRASQLVGKLSFSLPVLGGLLLWLTTPINALLLVALIALLVRDREELLAAVRGKPVARQAPAPVAAEPVPANAEPVVPVDPLQQALRDNDRVVPISDMSFPHELAVAEVMWPESILRLADRYDRPVLHDEATGVLFVVESSMLFRCGLETPAAVGAPGLAVVRDLVPQSAAAVAESEAEVARAAPVLQPVAEVEPARPTRDVIPAEAREQRHNWPSRRDRYGGRRKPSPHGRDWAYASSK